MSEDTFGVAMVNYACPICGRIANSAIAMNSRLTKKCAKEVKELHNKVVGWSEVACEECASHKDECIYVIEIDKEKSEPNNLYRTGNYWGLHKDFALFIDHPEYVLKTKDGVQYCFMDKEFANQIGLPHENN